MNRTGQLESIDVPIRASVRLALLLAAAHAGAMAAIVVLPLAWWLRLAACSLLLVSGAIMISRHALLKTSDSIVGLQLRRDGSCHLQLSNQRSMSGKLCPGWFASPLMIVLQIACPGQRWRRSITLLPDAVEPDSLRRMRVFLRFAVEPS